MFTCDLIQVVPSQLRVLGSESSRDLPTVTWAPAAELGFTFRGGSRAALLPLLIGQVGGEGKGSLLHGWTLSHYYYYYYFGTTD